MSEIAIQTASDLPLPVPDLPIEEDLQPIAIGHVSDLTGTSPPEVGGDFINIVWGQL